MADTWFDTLVDKLIRQPFSGGAGPSPNAYSRITQTPITIDPKLETQGRSGEYWPDINSIRISPNYTLPSATGQFSQIPHESAHAIFSQSPELKEPSNLAALAKLVPSTQRNLILGSPVYKPLPDYGSPEMLVDEGLGHSIGDSDATKYVTEVARRIKDPKLREQLLRLHMNAIQARRTSAIQ